MNLLILGIAFLSFTAVCAAIGYFSVDAIHYIRAWLYVRFFIRYEMAGCALEAKVREGQA